MLVFFKFNYWFFAAFYTQNRWFSLKFEGEASIPISSLHTQGGIKFSLPSTVWNSTYMDVNFKMNHLLISWGFSSRWTILLDTCVSITHFHNLGMCKNKINMWHMNAVSLKKLNLCKLVFIFSTGQLLLSRFTRVQMHTTWSRDWNIKIDRQFVPEIEN